MKKNRIVSVLLAAVMTVLSFTVVIAEEEKNEGMYTSEVKTMTALGFMKSINTEDENAAVTKGMFTAAVVSLMGYGMDGLSAVSPFSDVTESTAFYNEICVAAQYGIVHGDDELKFNPDSLISYSAAIVMLENAMGYYPEAMRNGGYPNGYIKTAVDMGLNRGLNTGEEGKLNVGMCAKLLLNAGDIEVVNDKLSGGVSIYEKGDKLFWDRHRIMKDSGVVRANEQTSIDSSAGAGQNGITIGDVNGYIYFSNESIEYLGYHVDFYYREEDSVNTILYMQPKKTDVTVINGADVNSFEDQKLTYYAGDKKKTETISRDVSVIFNGVYTIDYFFEDGTSIFTPEYGDIKLIDHNLDGKIDVVSILAYKNIVVSAVDKEECIVYDKYNKDNNLDYSSPEHTWVITDSSGNIMGFDQLQKWDVVSVAKSMDNKVLHAVVSRNSFSGTVKSVGEADRKKVVYTENGKYFVARSFLETQELPQAGAAVKFYLDYYGNIAAIENAGTANNYGFIIRAYYDQDRELCVAKLMDSEGAISYPAFADKVTIDGDQVSDEVLKRKLNISQGSDNPSAVGEFSLVVYKMNQKGEINYIDSVYKGPNEDNNTLYQINSYSGPFLWFSTSRLFGYNANSLCINAETAIFKTPPKEFSGDMKDYVMGSLSDLVYGTQYMVYGYSTNPDSVIPEAVHMPIKSEDSSSMQRNARTCIIKDIYQQANTEGEVAWIIEYYSGTEEYETYVAESVDASKYKPGDIIKVTLNSRGEISYINHVYSADTFGFTADNIYGTGSDFGNEYQPYAAKLFVLDNDVIGFTDSINADTSFKDCTFQRITDKDTAVYTVKNGRNSRVVSRITANDLPAVMDYYHHGEDTPIYLMTTYGVAKVLVIYQLNK